MNDDIKKIVTDATHKMILAHQAEDTLNQLLRMKKKEIINVIANEERVHMEDVAISWQPADGWIITDGEWELVPTQKELIKLLSL